MKRKTTALLTAALLIISASSCAQSAMSTASHGTRETQETAAAPVVTEPEKAERAEESEEEKLVSAGTDEDENEDEDKEKITSAGKTKLVWAICDYSGSGSELPAQAVNEYLESIGCDYEVEFKAISPERSEEWPPVITKDYSDFIKEDISGKGEIDIFYMPVPSGTSYEYCNYAADGLAESLDEYLESDAGRTLYELMPENHWEGLKVNGKIYGVDGGMHTLRDNAGLWYSTQMLGKYPEYDIALKPSEQIEVLLDIGRAENGNENPDNAIIALRGDLTAPAYYVNGECVSSAVYYDNDSGQFRSVLDDKNYTDALQEYFTLYNAGLLSAEWGSENMFARVFVSPGGCADRPFTAFNGREHITPVFGGTKHIVRTQTATGISAASHNKDKAFSLLALSQTDPYLNNLLTFGTEGEDYILENGRPDRAASPDNFYRFYCRMTGYPYTDRSYTWDIDTLETPEEIIRAYDQAVISGIYDFSCDLSGIEQEINDTDNVIAEKLGVLLSGNYDSFEDWLADTEYSLNEAGIVTITDSLNSQLIKTSKTE